MKRGREAATGTEGRRETAGRGTEAAGSEAQGTAGRLGGGTAGEPTGETAESVIPTPSTWVGLSYDSDEAAIRSVFEEFGEVKNLKVSSTTV